MTYRNHLIKETMKQTIDTATSNSPEWQRYQDELQKHEQFIKDYRFFLERIVVHLDWVKSPYLWTTEEIRKLIEAEIDKSSSMDAPNKPGYYRANND